MMGKFEDCEGRVVQRTPVLLGQVCTLQGSGDSVLHESGQGEWMDVQSGVVRVHFRGGYTDWPACTGNALPTRCGMVLEARLPDTVFIVRETHSTPTLINNNTGVKLPDGFSLGDTLGESKRAAAVLDGQTQGALQPTGSIREQLYKLQSAIGDLPEVHFPLQHTFAPGAYARTIQIPAGSVLVGKIHKHKHLNILSQGTVHVLTETGGVEVLTGPLTMVSEPGTKRAVFAVSDTTWTTIHLTSETDLAKIESEVIAPTYEAYEQFLRGETL